MVEGVDLLLLELHNTEETAVVADVPLLFDFKERESRARLRAREAGHSTRVFLVSRSRSNLVKR